MMLMKMGILFGSLSQLLLFALLGGIGGTLSQGFTKGWNNINWGVVGFDALMSGLTGLLVASGVGAVCLAVGATQT